MCRFDMFVLSISVLGQLLVIGLIISDSLLLIAFI